VRSERGAQIGPPARLTVLARLGFLYGRERGPAADPWSHRFLYVPHWFVLIVLAACSVPLAGRLRRTRRAKSRASADECLACGYDCRATPGRCPECGWWTGTTSPAPRIPAGDEHAHRRM
jgi:hypothetical protein